MEKRLLTVNEACMVLSYPRARLYELIARGPQAGGIASIKDGKARRIPVWAIDQYIARKVERGEESATA